VLTTIFASKGCEVKGEWKTLPGKEPHDLCFSQNIIRTTKSRKMRWVGNVARTGVRRGAARILMGRFEGRGPLWKTEAWMGG